MDKGEGGVKNLKKGVTSFKDGPYIIFFFCKIDTHWFLATATYLINWLVNGDGKDLLDHLNFHILPMANPDGYEYSRDHVSCFHERNSFDFIN